jgi:hypothetical protein
LQTKERIGIIGEIGEGKGLRSLFPAAACLVFLCRQLSPFPIAIDRERGGGGREMDERKKERGEDAPALPFSLHVRVVSAAAATTREGGGESQSGWEQRERLATGTEMHRVVNASGEDIDRMLPQEREEGSEVFLCVARRLGRR